MFWGTKKYRYIFVTLTHSFTQVCECVATQTQLLQTHTFFYIQTHFMQSAYSGGKAGYIIIYEERDWRGWGEGGVDGWGGGGRGDRGWGVEGGGGGGVKIERPQQIGQAGRGRWGDLGQNDKELIRWRYGRNSRVTSYSSRLPPSATWQHASQSPVRGTHRKDGCSHEW